MISRRQLSPENALVRLETLCARSEQCSYELMQKLRQWGIGQQDAADIIERLRAGRFVDDSRYAEAFVRDKYRFNRWGRTKIRGALMLKRIGSHVIEEAMAAVDDDEYCDILAEVLRNKARTLDDSRSYEGRQKLLRHAVSRGFEPSLVISLIKNGVPWEE